MTEQPIQAALAALRSHREDAPKNMRAAFASDPKRFLHFSVTDGDLLLDWSKCAVDADDDGAAGKAGRRRSTCPASARRCLPASSINVTEDRAVLHTALRNLAGEPAAARRP